MNDAPHTSSALHRWLRLAAPLLIVVAALIYYGSYIQFWFNPHDEGGTAALTAMRLLAGEAPIRDVDLGYNVGWFWPIVALFKVTGVHFLVMRGYFFALSTITALLGWSLVRRLTRNEWLALGVGLALVVFPGSQFKNYNPLLCVANMMCVANAALGAGLGVAAFWRRLAWGGLVLGLTLLVRIDIGYLFALLWVGFLVLSLFDRRLAPGRRLGDTILGAAILCAGVVVVHTPAWIAAKAGGYEKQFVAQYGKWAGYIGSEAQSVARPAAVAKPVAPVQQADRTTLPRVDWQTARSFRNADKSVLFVLTYAPLVIYVLGVGWAVFCIGRACVRREFALDQPASLALLVLIGSMAAFPQFFFFRPDRPHLSEFMPGYIVATVCVVALLGTRLRWIAAGLLAVQLVLFAWFALDHYSAGTIAARTMIKKNKRQLFIGANGVRVWVHKDKEFPELEGVRRAVVEHSRPGDWLVCYPYQPGYNVMTDRATYERDLYLDNATAPRGWDRRAIRHIEQKKPAVVVIDNRAINKVEASRFSVWAALVYEHLHEHYQLCGTFGAKSPDDPDRIEVFALKQPQPRP